MPELQKIDLRRLAEMSGADRAFLTFYASGSEGLSSLDRRIDELRAVLCEDCDELEHFERSLEMIEQWVEEHGKSLSGEGSVVFASWALDLVEGYDLAVDVPDTLRIGSAPYLRPLAEAQDDYGTFAVVATDNKSTAIYIVSSTQEEKAGSVRGDVKNAVKVGGWSQKRYARRRQKQLHNYAKDIADRLRELQEETDFERIVLLGSEETMREILDTLPTDLAEIVIAEEPFDLDSDQNVMIDEAFSIFFEDDKDEDQRLWKTIKNQALSEGLAVLGPTAVLEAAAIGRVDEVLVTRDAEIPATRCRDCENVFHGTPTTCQVCGSKDVFEADLVDELVRLCETTSARVDFTDPLPGLERAGHVAAALRY